MFSGPDLRQSRRRRLATAGLGALLLGLLGASGPLTCDRSAHRALYVLGEGSAVEEGCFDPCECPIRLIENLRGAMVLQPENDEPASPFRTFSVRWLSWVYGGPDRWVWVQGTGQYQVGGEFALTQRLVLGLQVGDEPVRRYDSGLVVGGSDREEFPPIEIAISRNDMYCYDRVFRIVAEPLAVF